MSASLTPIQPIPAETFAAYRSPEQIIAELPLAEQVAHYKLAWEIMRLELEQARIEIEQLKRAGDK